MTWESALGSAIEVAIAIAGFSGILAAVGCRGAGHWTEADQLRLRILLTSTGIALVFAFLPFLLIDLIDPSLVWRVGSALQVVWTVGILIYRARQVSIAPLAGAAIRPGPGRLILQIAVSSMLIANAVWFASSSVYVLGVLSGLVVAFMTFVDLLLESWNPVPTESPPAA
jgi:hypothetical protein